MPGVPPLLHRELTMIKEELQHRLTQQIISVSKQTKYAELSQLNYKARREMKNMIARLIYSYAKLDAWRSMAKATSEHGWTFPELLPATSIRFEAVGLSHPLLERPVPYDITFDKTSNFLVLTGANMS